MDTPDFSDIRGQALAINALVDAIARGEPGVLLIGPPGTGKTMIARRVPTILPELTEQERRWIETEYASMSEDYAGMRSPGQRGLPERPFRAPHHTVSAAGLVGKPWALREPRPAPCSCADGKPHKGHNLPAAIVPRAAELQLARFGVLMLDELIEFPRMVIRELGAARRRMHGAPFVVATSNPCACGWHGSEVRDCTCEGVALENYLVRERAAREALGIKVAIRVAPVNLQDLRTLPPGESSASIRARIVRASAETGSVP